MAKITIDDLEPIPATRAKVRFGDLIYQASVNGKRFMVNRQGKPVAVILSYNEYVKLIKQLKG